MPTASKIVAAVLFAIVGAVAAHLFIPAMPEGSQIGYFREITAGIGLLCGWWIMGRATGKGFTSAINSGLVTSVMLLAWSMLGFSIYLMVKKSTRMMYDGPMDALLGVFDLMYEYGAYLAQPATPLALVIGGVIGGLLSEVAGRKWS